MKKQQDQKDLELRKVREFIQRKFGNRCRKYCAGCPTCEAWRSYDVLFCGVIDDVCELEWEILEVVK